MPFVFIPINTLALDRIAPRDIGDATGLFSLTRELGGSIGTAALSTVISRATAAHRWDLMADVTPFSPAAASRYEMTSGRMAVLLGDTQRGAEAALAALNGTVMRQALILAFNDAFFVASCTAVALIGVVVWMDRPVSAARGPVGGH
jgi:DHA2 family multidrug resistance protein